MKNNCALKKPAFTQRPATFELTVSISSQYFFLKVGSCMKSHPCSATTCQTQQKKKTLRTGIL